MKFDVIIPCAEKDISFLPRVIKYIRKNLIGADVIFIICNAYCVQKVKQIAKLDNKVVGLNENELVEGLSFKSVAHILQEKTGAHTVVSGWYLQQLLKLAFARTKYATKDYYLSWDADTLPISEIHFFKEDNRPIFTKKFE